MHSAAILCLDDVAGSPLPLVATDVPGVATLRRLARDAATEDALAREPPIDVVVAALHPARAQDQALLRDLKQRWPESCTVLVAPRTDVELAVGALHAGLITRYVAGPAQGAELVTAVREALAERLRTADERRLREQLARIHAELDERVRELDEANELLEYWVEFSPAVLYSLSCDAGHLHPSYVGKNFHRLTGFERTAAVVDAEFWPGLVHPADVGHYSEALHDLAGPERAFAVLEYRVRHRDGSYLTVVDSLRAVRDGDGRTIEIVGAWLDVTARE